MVLIRGVVVPMFFPPHKVSQPAQLAATEPVAPAAPNQTQQAKLPAPKADVQMAVVPVTVTAKSAAPQAPRRHSVEGRFGSFNGKFKRPLKGHSLCDGDVK